MTDQPDPHHPRALVEPVDHSVAASDPQPPEPWVTLQRLPGGRPGPRGLSEPRECAGDVLANARRQPCEVPLSASLYLHVVPQAPAPPSPAPTARSRHARRPRPVARPLRPAGPRVSRQGAPGGGGRPLG